MTFKQINTIMKDIKEAERLLDNSSRVNEYWSYVVDGFKIKYEKGLINKSDYWFSMWKENDDQFFVCGPLKDFKASDFINF